MRFGNPSVRKISTNAQSGAWSVEVEPATYGGIAKKTIFYALLTVLSAILSSVVLKNAFNTGDYDTLNVLLVGVAISAIPMIVIAFVIAFVPSTAKVLGSIYCIMQGLCLGLMVYFIDSLYPGIAFAAVLGTIVVFVMTIVLNQYLEVRVSNRFFRACFIAFCSLIVVELIMLVLSLFGIVMFSQLIWLQVLISAICVFMAAVTLMWDLQNVENMVNCGVDKRYEWNVSFSLITTLIYLYIEILELLLRLAMIFGKNRD